MTFPPMPKDPPPLQGKDTVFYLDGAEFIRQPHETGFQSWRKTVEEIKANEPNWKEIKVMVWKDRHGIYLQEFYASRGAL